MPDLKGLATRMAPDKGYAEDPRGPGGSGGPRRGPRTFVCPRANAYGGREGIIPPAVAAVRGLVPKGMRHIDVADTARSANAARDSGVDEASQYMEYYGRAAKAAAFSARSPAVPFMFRGRPTTMRSTAFSAHSAAMASAAFSAL